MAHEQHTQTHIWTRTGIGLWKKQSRAEHITITNLMEWEWKPFRWINNQSAVLALKHTQILLLHVIISYNHGNNCKYCGDVFLITFFLPHSLAYTFYAVSIWCWFFVISFPLNRTNQLENHIIEELLSFVFVEFSVEQDHCRSLCPIQHSVFGIHMFLL